jgi:site-specific recombinase XerD
MSIYQVQRKAERFGTSFRVCDSTGAGVGSCNQFLMELSLRDCSVYTQRAYALGLAHFLSWLHASRGDPDQVTRQIVGSYITEFARGAKEGAVATRFGQKPRQPRTINHRLNVLASYFEYCIRRDTEDGRGPWKGRINPASGNPLTEELRHGMIGRDLPARQRQRDGFRRRIPRTLPKVLEPVSIQKLIDSALRYIGRKAGISVHPHLFRHTLAQGVLETTGNIKVAQEILGHSHLSTTADLYLRVDQHAMVTALAVAKSSAERTPKQRSWPSARAAQYAFDYDDETIAELERAIARASGAKPAGGDS